MFLLRGSWDVKVTATAGRSCGRDVSLQWSMARMERGTEKRGEDGRSSEEAPESWAKREASSKARTMGPAEHLNGCRTGPRPA